VLKGPVTCRPWQQDPLKGEGGALAPVSRNGTNGWAFSPGMKGSTGSGTGATGPSQPVLMSGRATMDAMNLLVVQMTPDATFGKRAIMEDGSSGMKALRKTMFVLSQYQISITRTRVPDASARRH